MPVFQRVYRAYGLLLYGCGIIAQAAVAMLLVLVLVDMLAGFFIKRQLASLLPEAETPLMPTAFLALALTQYEGDTTTRSCSRAACADVGRAHSPSAARWR